MVVRLFYLYLNIIFVIFYFIYFNFYYINNLNEIFVSNEKIKSMENNKSNFNIYFLKTHKTGSTTLKNIMMRIMKKRKMFQVKNFEIKEDQNLRFNNKIFFEHKRFNLSEVEFFFPKNQTIYITILRNPADQILSTINYCTNLKEKKKSIFNNINNETFFKLLDQKNTCSCILRNSVAFDFGIVNCSEKYYGSKNELIKRFEETFDFVLLTEYFNEGLILLKKFLKLSFKEIVHLELNRGIEKIFTEEKIWAQSVISNVSNADVILYDYYLQIYKKISKSLKKEVTELEKKNIFYEKLCFKRQKIYKNSFNNFHFKFVLKRNLTIKQKEFCNILIKL